MKISFNFFPRLETFDVLLLQADSPGADFIWFLSQPKQLLKPLVTAIYDESFPSCSQACKSSSLCVSLITALTISARFASYFEILLSAGTYKIAIQDLVAPFKGSLVCDWQSQCTTALIVVVLVFILLLELIQWVLLWGFSLQSHIHVNFHDCSDPGAGNFLWLAACAERFDHSWRISIS